MASLPIPRHQHKAQNSISSTSNANSVRSTRKAPSTIVVTSPPWARDEPPSPDDENTPTRGHLAEPRPSDVGSVQSSSMGQIDGSRWWAFTRKGTRERSQIQVDEDSAVAPKPERRGLSLNHRSLSWLPSASSRLGGADGMRFGLRRERDPEAGVQSVSGLGTQEPTPHDWNFHLALPTPSEQPFTLSQNRTPGWDTPWTPRIENDDVSYMGITAQDDDSEKAATTWGRRRKQFRAFILSNPYVPILFRFANITLTTAALALAIRIRIAEARNHVRGIVGSSPTLVIIFAPLTLVHVIVSIYLEYFGRPLGLWRTSRKLMHTLSEVLFICAWSAALSLCFDNFFTSLIPCASASNTSWYNSIPRPTSSASNLGGTGENLCDDQVALICLVGLGLIAYCVNLVISLFRIFEKVKYHPPVVPR